MNNRISGKNLPAGYVRENFYLCYDGDDMVGVFNLKFELTEFLLNFGGHIGYAVKPSRRSMGCASERVIIKNGGIFENRLYDDEEKVFVKRYWIDL